MRHQQTFRLLASIACCAVLGCQPDKQTPSTTKNSDREVTRSPETDEAGTPAPSSERNSPQTAHAEEQDEHPSAPPIVSVVSDQKQSKPPSQLTKTGGARPAAKNLPSLQTELQSESPPRSASDEEAPTEMRETFHENGALLRQWIVKILPDGTEVEHGESLIRYDDGQVKMQGEYFDGVRTGLWRSWYSDGIMRGEGQLHMDRRVGTWVMWYASGQKRIETPYETGLSHGTSTSWDEDGKVMETGEYVRGKKHGIWITYVDGEKTETEWVKGVEVE